MNTDNDFSRDRIQPLPEDLLQSLEGKDEAVVSTLLSTHRTQLSEHRTNLSEHRTSLSDRRTGLSDLRSHLSNERTHLSYLRTAVSMIGFGITLNRFSIYLRQNHALVPDQSGPLLRDAQNAGSGMVVLGLLMILWSLYRYWRVNQDIKRAQFVPRDKAVMAFTFLLILLGTTTAFWLFLAKT
ncbi:YidH family protein [Lysobacter niabensis]|uniref:YidH family protein n=1 Tax=Agrilutibacter niabensis TaxID=380628 RepID=UPI003619CFE6